MENIFELDSTIAATPESHAVTERKLVDMLQQLEHEIVAEASALESWQSLLQSATKSGDAYSAAKLRREGADRGRRLEALRAAITDVEAVHRRLLVGLG